MAASLRAVEPEVASASTTEQEFQAFSYIVSHDLAAAIRHLTEFSRLLLGDLGEGLTARQRGHADYIRTAGDHCTAMLEQLLVFSRVQQKTLVKVDRDATASLRLLAMQFAARAEAAGGEIAWEPLGDVYADEELLALAFTHLMDNALKFVRPGVPPRIAVHAAHDESYWRMRISDNGLGVEPSLREPAFRMFRRLHGGDAYPGVGAGLAICRRIARLHGGEARFLDSAEGACVELALPHACRSPKSARKH